MKICLLSDKYPPERGGLAVSAQRLARGLHGAGHHVTVCVMSAKLPPGQTKRVNYDGVTVYRVGKHDRDDDTLSAWFDAICALHRRLGGFDIIHAYYAVNAGFVGVYAGRYLHTPTIVSVRGNDLERGVFYPAKTGGVLWALANADAVTTVTRDLSRKAAALAPGQCIETIFNSVDTETFKPGRVDPRITADLNADGIPLIGFVGEARAKKGFAPLLAAFARVAERRPGARLLLVGGMRPDCEPILSAFRTRYPEVEVWDVLHLPHEDLPYIYNLLDVLVIPSLHDGMPNALLEGMASGCAVVASDAGGIPDVMRHERTGILVAPGAIEELAAAILDLLDHPERRRKLGGAARAHMLAHFAPSREIDANVALYNRLTGRSNRDEDDKRRA
ncbi:MAG: glycosyltransferase family 4 protein [Chloroflexi bacterium]|nr:glycosyltransferase family 4 protein [Chloroflexota bacterium]